MAKDDNEIESIAGQSKNQDPSDRAETEGVLGSESEVTTPPANDVGSDGWMLKQTRNMYTKSTDYLEANISNTWETSISHFHSEHSSGTTYHNKNFKRSRVFRPKTRANVKSQEAKLLVAMFGSRDLIIVEAENSADPQQVVSAKINKWLLQHRMDKKMPWTLTALGAYQNTKVYGVCFSHQHWAYEVDESITPVMHDDGSPVMGFDAQDNEVPMGKQERVIRRDELVCDLIEPENMRFDPNADWRDPLNTSPYLIMMVPMYAGDVLEKMQNNDPKTQKPYWRKHDLAGILATRRDTYNRTRQAREGNRRLDPADQENGNEFTLVWAHMNIMRVNGEDYFWWTLGTEVILTDMKRLSVEYPHLMVGERPFTMGFSTLEAHRNYPAGDVEQGAGLQSEINTVANQRLDNVKLVLNKRYFVKRGSQTDLEALMRNVSGGGVMMNDPEKDVKVIDTRDVTGSSYEEQDRLAREHDDLVGNFSQANRPQQGQGGDSKFAAEQAGSSAGMVQDYGMSLFILTWVEKTIYQLLRLIQMYESDETLLALAAEDAKLFQRFGTGVDDDLLRKSLTVTVDVGVGNTDPLKRVERLTFGVNQVAALPGMAERMKSEDISNEIWSALGYRDGTRFFRNEEEQAEYTEANPQQPPLEHQQKMRELDIREEDNKMRDTRETKKLDTEGANRESTKREAADKMTADADLKRKELQDKRDIEAGKIADNQVSQIRSMTGV